MLREVDNAPWRSTGAEETGGPATVRPGFQPWRALVACQCWARRVRALLGWVRNYGSQCNVGPVDGPPEIGRHRKEAEKQEEKEEEEQQQQQQQQHQKEE
jgi:hypothetical protein